MKFEILLQGKLHTVEFENTPSGPVFTLDGKPLAADALELSPGVYSILLEGRSHEVRVSPAPGGGLKLQSGEHEFSAEISDPRAWRGRRHGTFETEGRQQILAPMPGKVVRVLAQAGDRVEAGQGLLVVEAMKMQNEIRSPKGGVVERLAVKEGQAVNAGDVLAVVG
ncbi:MAG: biotin/lipoyl-binding protein [Acidobacteriia bacterium]|nr:biotin/lipoyl-binding protein [Terriglobia bacterium]